jgi:alpha-1,3-fucosyltransferase 10
MIAPIPAKTEAAPLVMFQSSSFDCSGRNAYAAELMRHVPIDSFGRFLNNRQLDSPDAGSDSKREVISRYRFCIAFENAIEFDYVTEKLYDPLLAGTVPIYRGAPNVEDFAPGADSFINADRFPSPRDLAAFLLHLSRSPAEYERYFAWRHRPLPPALEARAAKSGVPLFSCIADWVERTYPPRTVSRTGGSRPFRLFDSLAVRRLERRREVLRAGALRRKEPSR